MNLHEYIQQKQIKNATCYTSQQQQRKISQSTLDPTAFYRQFGIILKAGGAWQMVKCPFHDDTHASMGVNRIHGGFKCHACDVSGDMIGFYMKYKGVDFKTAIHDLKLGD